MGARIRAIEYAVPEKVVTNDDLKKMNPDWDLDLIAAKTGVYSRHIAGEGELALDLAYRAALKLFAVEDIKRESIDAVIFCTQSPDYIMPANANLLHAKLELSNNVAAFDITLACSGYVYGLAIAKSLIESMNYRNVLLVTGDTYSKYIHPRDRSALVIFGDGAAVTLIEKSDSEIGIDKIELGTDGKRAEKFIVRAGGLRLPKSAATGIPKTDITGCTRSSENIHMDGGAILKFATGDVPNAISSFLQKNELSIADFDLVLFHQASAQAVKHLQEALSIPVEKTFSNLSRIGNTVSSSLPILLKDAEYANKLKRGDRILLAGFGVGLSWGCCRLVW